MKTVSRHVSYIFRARIQEWVCPTEGMKVEANLFNLHRVFFNASRAWLKHGLVFLEKGRDDGMCVSAVFDCHAEKRGIRECERFEHSWVVPKIY